MQFIERRDRVSVGNAIRARTNFRLRCPVQIERYCATVAPLYSSPECLFSSLACNHLSIQMDASTGTMRMRPGRIAKTLIDIRVEVEFVRRATWLAYAVFDWVIKLSLNMAVTKVLPVSIIYINTTLHLTSG